MHGYAYMYMGTCMYTYTYIHMYICKKCTTKQLKITKQRKKVHSPVWVRASIYVCVFLLARRNAWVRVCVRVWARHSPIAAATRAKTYRHSNGL